MTRDEFDNLLRLWGWAFGPRRQEQEEGAGMYGTSALAGLGRPATIRQSTTMDRGGVARRRMLGVAAGLVDDAGVVHLVPAWTVEPVRGTQTRTGAAKVLAPDFSIPADALRVEQSVTRLRRQEHDLATALRTQFCTVLGGQRDKADHLGLRLGVYRERLAEAKGWVRRDLDA
ncbi:hypothetical protein [Xanthomonas sp. NCPPB 1128]|uniref:hypothetical protein n=1 Tax=Xanthomonas sp. NCPPB 1128 TaxID=1775876 RepID=UPI000AC285EC|nr:hypothetical protein [Xanthomonas sp. NCPPB 1128]